MSDKMGLLAGLRNTWFAPPGCSGFVRARAKTTAAPEAGDPGLDGEVAKPIDVSSPVGSATGASWRHGLHDRLERTRLPAEVIVNLSRACAQASYSTPRMMRISGPDVQVSNSELHGLV
jgi:hypothetical protein